MGTFCFGFPNMFNVAKNTASITSDSDAILTRIRLLLMTEPTELYGEPDFGVGLKKYLFRYNNDNVIAEMRDRIVDQLSKWEPRVNAQETKLIKSNSENIQTNESNNLNLTLIVYTVYGDEVSVDLSEFMAK